MREVLQEIKEPRIKGRGCVPNLKGASPSVMTREVIRRRQAGSAMSRLRQNPWRGREPSVGCWRPVAGLAGSRPTIGAHSV